MTRTVVLGPVDGLISGAAGEQVSTTVFAMEYESPEALGAAFDSMNQDAELQAFTARFNSAASPSAICR